MLLSQSVIFRCESFFARFLVRLVSAMVLLPISLSVADESIDVVSYNIRLFNPGDGQDHWPHRADAVSDFIAKWDIVGLQEVTPIQVKELREQLGDAYGFFGVGREDGKNEGEHAAVFFRKSRLEVIEKTTFWLCETQSKAGSMGWDAACPRTVSWMRLRDKKTGKLFYFANTHFDHRGVTARARSAEMIRERVRSLKKDSAVIVLGDFNCTPDSQPYRHLTNDALTDARLVAEQPLAGPSSTWNGFKKIVPDRIIDHVFVAGKISVQQFQIHDPKTESGRFASDHLPVRVRVLLK